MRTGKALRSERNAGLNLLADPHRVRHAQPDGCDDAA